MKITKLIPLIVVPFVLSGCNQNPPKRGGGENSESDGTVTLKLAPVAKTTKATYEISFNYKDSFFDHSATKFDDGLKLLSFASACVGGFPEIAAEFYTTMYFDNQETYGYDIPITADTVAYYMAHKTINDYDLIALSIRGNDYGEEWANNCLVGATGNHAGFTLRANEIYTALEDYVSRMVAEERTAKIWISGYSRAGGIANVLADKLMSTENSYVTGDNLFVYTFEAPACIATENKVEYANVFNLINSRDLVVNIPPEAYGLVRCGIDIDIYNASWKNMVYKFDSDIEIPEFHSKSGSYSDERGFINYLLSCLMAEPSDASYAAYSLATRESYATTFQDNIGYFMGFYFKLNDEQKEALSGSFDGLTPMAFLTAFYTENGLYNLLSPALIDSEVEYEETKLKTALEVLRIFLISHPDLMLEMIDTSSQKINENTIENIERIIFMHYAEVTYSLISQQKFANR